MNSATHLHMVWNQLPTLPVNQSMGNMNFAHGVCFYIVLNETFWSSKVFAIWYHFLFCFFLALLSIYQVSRIICLHLQINEFFCVYKYILEDKYSVCFLS